MSIRTLFFKAKMQRGKNALSLLVFSSLFVFGFFAGSYEVNAQPYGSCGWCPCGIDTCDGGWSMGVNGPYGTSPGNLSACPVSGGGCLAGQNGYCTGSDGSYYSYSCENSGGGDGGTMTCSEVDTPVLSYSCNATGTQATISIAGRSMNNMFSSRVDVLSPSWGNRCPATSPDLCETRSSFTVNIVPGMPNNAWAHPWQGCGGYGLERTDIVGSISFVCSPPPPPAPVPDLRINGSNGPLAVSSGANLNLKWGAVANATSCRAIAGSGWAVASKDQNGGNDNIPATVTSTYTLSCTGAGGTGTDSVVVNVNVPPPPPPIDPTGLTATCLAPDRVRLSWNPVASATMYGFRADYATPSWNPCVSPDECRDLFTNSYEKTVTPGVTYDWWVHAVNASGWSPGIHGPNFRCDYPASTIRGRITNQATGAGIPGVVIPACAANPGATTDASGNYSFTVPYDARFCIRPSTPVGVSANPLLSGLQPSQRVSTHTYEWQVAGWNAGVHPLCDNFDSVNRIPASCDEWKQWDRATDTGYDFSYSSIPAPTATVSLDPAAINIHPTAGSSTVRVRWSSTNATSCAATSGTGFATGGATSSPGVVVPTPGSVGSYPYSIRCTGPGGPKDASASLNVVSVCNPTTTCTASDICQGESCNNGCTTVVGTKDCRKFWKEVAP